MIFIDRINLSTETGDDYLELDKTHKATGHYYPRLLCRPATPGQYSYLGKRLGRGMPERKTVAVSQLCKHCFVDELQALEKAVPALSN